MNIHYSIVRSVASALEKIFMKGDAIAIDMPMTCTAVIIYLSIVLAGCIVVSIADSFTSNEIAKRMEVAKARGIFTQVRSSLDIHQKEGNIIVLKRSIFYSKFCGLVFVTRFAAM